MRELLLALGLDHPAINNWIASRRSSSDEKNTTGRQCRKLSTRDIPCSKAQEGESSSTTLSQPLCSASCTKDRRTDGSIPSESLAKLPDRLSDATAKSRVDNLSSPPQTILSNSVKTHDNADLSGSSPKEPINPERRPSQVPPAPCKLLARFAANPSSDVTQILAGSETGSKLDGADGAFPCESAYKLLMQYATSEEKLEALSRTLEGGCIPNSDGGCQVKNETVSQALLDICL